MNFEDNQQETQHGWEDYWDLAKRRRWWLLGLAFAGWAIAIVAGYAIPPTYKSETVILVDQPKVSSQYVTPNLTADLQTQLQSLTQQILSRTRLLRIIDDFQLYRRARARGEDAAVDEMRRRIEIEEIKPVGSPLELAAFKISYAAPSPKVAQDVTGRLTSLFIEENLRNQQQLSQDTTNFLESQLEDARKDLEKQEQQLQQFRSAYLGQLPEQTQSNMQILGGLQGRLDAATEALNHAEQQRLYFESLLSQYRMRQTSAASTTANTSAAAMPQSLQQQLERLKAELAEAEAKYTPRHPDVIRIRKRIAELESLKQDAELQTNASQKQSPDLNTDPAELQLQSEAKANALEITNRRKEMQEVERQIEQYQGRLNLAPVREQQLAALTRNYNQSRTNYESLLSKKMQSQMATNLEKRQQGAQFRVLDAPSLPRKPFSPNRLKFAVAGLAGGFILGVLLSVTMEFLNGRVYSERDLTNITGASVIAIIPPIPTPDDLSGLRRRRTLEFVIAGLMLTIIPAGTLLAFIKG
jgi:succinoglycan biosynthesis transport protein ExoP